MEGRPGTGHSRKEKQEGGYPKRLPIEFAENHLFQNKTPPEEVQNLYQFVLSEPKISLLGFES